MFSKTSAERDAPSRGKRRRTGLLWLLPFLLLPLLALYPGTTLARWGNYPGEQTVVTWLPFTEWGWQRQPWKALRMSGDRRPSWRTEGTIDTYIFLRITRVKQGGG